MFDKQIDKGQKQPVPENNISYMESCFLQSGQYACDCAEFQGWAEKLSVSGKYGLHRFG